MRRSLLLAALTLGVLSASPAGAFIPREDLVTTTTDGGSVRGRLLGLDSRSNAALRSDASFPDGGPFARNVNLECALAASPGDAGGGETRRTNRYEAFAGNAGLHDEEGNLVDDGNCRKFEYDWPRRLNGVVEGTNRAQCWCNALGRRLSRRTETEDNTHFPISGWSSPMAGLVLEGVVPEVRPTAVYASALLHALARDEAAGRRPARLTEPGLATWKRFHGRLSKVDFVRLLFEDAAVLHPIPFDAAGLDSALQVERLPESLVAAWLQGVSALELRAAGADYTTAQAELLGLPTRLARSELHAVKPHQRVLELPGTGGQLAHHIVSTNPGLTLQGNAVVACATWQELTMAGIVALDLAAPDSRFAVRVNPADLRNADHGVRQQRFDFVVGLHPDKGGLFRAEDQLDIWFSGARILLV